MSLYTAQYWLRPLFPSFEHNKINDYHTKKNMARMRYMLLHVLIHLTKFFIDVAMSPN